MSTCLWKWKKSSDSFQNSGCLNLCWFSHDHSRAINLEEFLILSQVCINRLKLMLKCRQILKEFENGGFFHFNRFFRLQTIKRPKDLLKRTKILFIRLYSKYKGKVRRWFDPLNRYEMAADFYNSARILPGWATFHEVIWKCVHTFICAILLLNLNVIHWVVRFNLLFPFISHLSDSLRIRPDAKRWNDLQLYVGYTVYKLKHNF